MASLALVALAACAGDVGTDGADVDAAQDADGLAEHSVQDAKKALTVNGWEWNLRLMVNRERVSRGLPELAWSGDLIVEAQRWARHMAASATLEHRPQLAEGVTGNWFLIAENVAWAPDIESAHANLMKSAGHRQNILDGRSDQIGVGVARAPTGGLYVCEIFKGVR